MHLTDLPAAASSCLLAAHPSPGQDAQSALDRTASQGGTARAHTDRQHHRDAHIGAPAVHRQ